MAGRDGKGIWPGVCRTVRQWPVRLPCGRILLLFGPVQDVSGKVLLEHGHFRHLLAVHHHPVRLRPTQHHFIGAGQARGSDGGQELSIGKRVGAVRDMADAERTLIERSQPIGNRRELCQPGVVDARLDETGLVPEDQKVIIRQVRPLICIGVDHVRGGQQERGFCLQDRDLGGTTRRTPSDRPGQVRQRVRVLCKGGEGGCVRQIIQTGGLRFDRRGKKHRRFVFDTRIEPLKRVGRPDHHVELVDGLGVVLGGLCRLESIVVDPHPVFFHRHMKNPDEMGDDFGNRIKGHVVPYLVMRKVILPSTSRYPGAGSPAPGKRSPDGIRTCRRRRPSTRSATRRQPSCRPSCQARWPP